MEENEKQSTPAENNLEPNKEQAVNPVTAAQEITIAKTDEAAFMIKETALMKKVEQLNAEIATKLIGQNDLVEKMTIALFCNGHALIEGVPGIAKTLAAKLFTKVLDVGFSRIQFTPDLMPSDIIGTSIYNTKTGEFEFKKGPIFSNIILIDEVNRAPAKTQSALFEAMEERQVSVDGTTYKLPDPFMVLATQNPVEHEGTYKLPEAQLDRFLFKIDIAYPDLEEEIQILQAALNPKEFYSLENVKPVLSAKDIADFKTTIGQVKVEANLLKYIAQITEVTRGSNQLFLGASPRASIGILMASKALAAINGRDFVTPEDIKECLSPILKHRLILTPEKEIEGITIDQIIDEIVEQVEIPR
jgi:MoxR-like ATPase